MADQIPSVYGLESTAVDLYGAAISLLVVTWTAALLRAYVRIHMLNSVGWDDWTLVPTLVSGIILGTVVKDADPLYRSPLQRDAHIY